MHGQLKFHMSPEFMSSSNIRRNSAVDIQPDELKYSVGHKWQEHNQTGQTQQVHTCNAAASSFASPVLAIPRPLFQEKAWTGQDAAAKLSTLRWVSA